MRKLVILGFCLLFPAMVTAIDTGQAFDDPELQARYEHIIDEVRCLKCQNQTIKDSNAFLADDLRREIKRMLTEGMTDAEIYRFSGAFATEILCFTGHEMSGKTLVLWIAPFYSDCRRRFCCSFKVVRGRDGDVVRQRFR